MTIIKPLNVDELDNQTNFATPSVSKHIPVCSDHESAIIIFQKIYIKPKNIIFARHLLPTAYGPVLPEFVIPVGCDSKAVSTDEHGDKCIRDSSIRKLKTNQIWQRPREEKKHDHVFALDIARLT